MFAPTSSALSASWWDVQAIDTMKYSRDLSREKLDDTSFAIEIAKQMHRISETGATHVGIATPYDDEFLPILRKWVTAARAEGLHIWFRGNWSGWEGWFGYPKITREEHLQKTKAFLEDNKNLFEDGDIFSACPECENGGPGDPRSTGDIVGYRKFIISEYRVIQAAFKMMDKDVTSNWQSMNADVARVVMDKETTSAMGGLIVIDHYVQDPKQIAKDIAQIALQSGGMVALGEFGAPIPDLHGFMSEEEQADWIDSALQELSASPAFAGISYWTNMLGSTKLWNDDGSPRAVVGVLKKYYTPKTITGTITGVLRRAVKGAKLTSTEGVKTVTDGRGFFVMPYLKSPIDVTVTYDGYANTTRRVTVRSENELVNIRLVSEGFFATARLFFCGLLRAC